MQDRENMVVTKPRRVPWNKGKLIGAKPPLRPKHVWSIRTKLQVEGRTRTGPPMATHGHLWPPMATSLFASGPLLRIS